MNEAISKELDELLLIHQDTGLNNQQQQRLAELLKSSPEARKQFAQQQLIDAAIYLEKSAGLDLEAVTRLNDDLNNEPITPKVARSTALSVGWIGLVATMIAALGIGLGLGSYFSQQNSNITIGNTALESTDDSVALLDRALNVEWAQDQPPISGAPLTPGKLAISKGLIQIEFYSGSRVIVEGPAEIELVGANEAICHHGKMRAYVPDHARGFTIHSPKFQLVDLGTEFGIEVKPDGQSEVQVFDGEVELYDIARQDQGPTHRLYGGNGLVWAESGETTKIKPQPENYTSFDDIQDLSVTDEKNRLDAWQKWSQNIANDPRLIAYYNFETREGSALTDRGPSAYHGTIVGSEWNQGRFPGKSALEFKRPGDRVRVNIEGEYAQLTMAAWLRMDALTGRTQALFTTDGFELGEAHWQVSSRGSLSLGVRLSENPATKQWQAGYDSGSIFTPQVIGRWSFVTMVYDQSLGSVQHYLNGQQISSSTIKFNQKLTFGPSEIGNWRQDQYHKNKGHLVRNFSGRIDEFVIWKTALPSEEIEAIYQATRP